MLEIVQRRIFSCIVGRFLAVNVCINVNASFLSTKLIRNSSIILEVVHLFSEGSVLLL